MLDKKKLQDLISELETVEMKIETERSVLSHLELIKRNLEIEFENGLYGDFTDDELMGCVV